MVFKLQLELLFTEALIDHHMTQPYSPDYSLDGLWTYRDSGGLCTARASEERAPAHEAPPPIVPSIHRTPAISNRTLPTLRSAVVPRSGGCDAGEREDSVPPPSERSVRGWTPVETARRRPRGQKLYVNGLHLGAKWLQEPVTMRVLLSVLYPVLSLTIFGLYPSLSKVSQKDYKVQKGLGRESGFRVDEQNQEQDRTTGKGHGTRDDHRQQSDRRQGKD
ncbi:hypothetical protein EYF80_024655 [Liparis tanakae]|uniref:Uncharacterized protein n=1 Tax=Liparis tanakae TaxID=230148 RepID=A0A4Z2HHA7_9TELE|nr:hypothetical protein EYF80_024655 [Liparis tanakae]